MPELRSPYLSVSIKKKGIKDIPVTRVEFFPGEQWPRYPEGAGKIRIRINGVWHPENKMQFFSLAEVISDIVDTFAPPGYNMLQFKNELGKYFLTKT
jgi:hypothetical protein